MDETEICLSATSFPLQCGAIAQRMQMISPLCRTIILRSFLPILPEPFFIWKPPAEAESSRNSLFWNILQGTSLFSRFYSETIPATSRKQGICLQNTERGYSNSMVSGVLFGLRPQPLLQLRLLQLAQLDAAVDGLQGMLDGLIGGGNLVRGKEFFHIGTGVGGAEQAG